MLGIPSGAVRKHPGRLFPVKVRGQSMLPTLRPGDLLAVSRPRRPLPVGSVVVVRLPGGAEAVKRLASILPDGSIEVTGDNPPRSTDSRTLGAVSIDDVIGIAQFVYWPPTRWRLL